MPSRSRYRPTRPAVAAALVLCGTLSVHGQNPAPPPGITAEQDHQQMMKQLGIRILHLGVSGNGDDPNHAASDESKANPIRNFLPPCC